MSLRALSCLAVAALAVGCKEPARETPRPTAFTAVAPVAPPMECRFEPVSLPGERAVTGVEMCYTSGDPPPWWLTLTPDAGTGAVDAAGDGPTAAATDAGTEPAACPPEMVLVEGSYCPNVKHRCLEYLDDKAPGGFLSRHRCAQFDETPSCAGGRELRRFCIDRDEYTPEGAELPLVDHSWTMARDLCTSLGKRLCFESEWQFACEGEQMRPYPYGFKREAKRCNHDQTNLTRRGKLRDLRVPSKDRPDCVSPFGVRNMVGNVDEWAHRDGLVKPYRAALRGGWWLAGRNNCLAATTGHDEYYLGPQTGVRCCMNPR